jgi:hypothetical protein
MPNSRDKRIGFGRLLTLPNPALVPTKRARISINLCILKFGRLPYEYLPGRFWFKFLTAVIAQFAFNESDAVGDEP